MKVYGLQYKTKGHDIMLPEVKLLHNAGSFTREAFININNPGQRSIGIRILKKIYNIAPACYKPRSDIGSYVVSRVYRMTS